MDDPRLHLHIEYLGGSGPVQAWGSVDGKQFYFRARHNRWSFAVAFDPQIDPADIDFPEQGFYREKAYVPPGSEAASTMPLEEAESIVRQCVKEFLAQAS